MAHKTLVGGTAYEISGGKTLVNGTAYSIKNGKTLVGGTAYEVGFVSGIPITIKGYGGYNMFSSPDASVNIDGTTYSGSSTGETSIVYVPIGTVITCTVYSRIDNNPGTIALNGEVVAKTAIYIVASTYVSKSYNYTVNSPITIELSRTAVDSKYYGTINITEQ